MTISDRFFQITDVAFVLTIWFGGDLVWTLMKDRTRLSSFLDKPTFIFVFAFLVGIFFGLVDWFWFVSDDSSKRDLFRRALWSYTFACTFYALGIKYVTRGILRSMGFKGDEE